MIPNAQLTNQPITYNNPSPGKSFKSQKNNTLDQETIRKTFENPTYFNYIYIDGKVKNPQRAILGCGS